MSENDVFMGLFDKKVASQASWCFWSDDVSMTGQFVA